MDLTRLSLLSIATAAATAAACAGAPAAISTTKEPSKMTTPAPAAPARADDSGVVELRQYTLHPGRRDELIALFEGEFVETQEATGIRVLGTFRDLDRPDHFVWLRGFRDLAARAPALDAFYSGPAWRAHRAAANATMIDSDDVLLLRPVKAGGALAVAQDRPPVGAPAPSSLVVATVYLLTAPVDDDFRALFEREIAPRAALAGAGPIARFETEPARNDYPRLPVREGVHAFVWVTSFASAADHERYLGALRQQPGWSTVAEPTLAKRLASPPQQLRLAPTARSLMRHAAPADPPGYTLARTGGLHDFDFIAGTWTVTNRRLKARGVGSTEWDEFPAVICGRTYLDGFANADLIEFPTKGWAGLTVRSFDRAKQQWSIYWISSRTGTLFPPVVGGFAGNRGEFYGTDEDDGRPVKVRFVWTKLGPDKLQWEQSFSYDNGPWELNWMNVLTRTGARCP